jgi:PAS domain S-box-containing protein
MRTTAATSPPFDNVEHLFAACPIAIAHTDGQGRLDYCNAAFERMFGWQATEATGKELGILIGLPDTQIKGTLRRAARDEPVHLTTSARRQDGEPISVELHVVLHASPAGAAGFWGLFQDLTERHKVEHLLRLTREMLFRAFQASPTTIAFSSVRENRLIKVNNTWVRMTGYTPEEAIGHTPLELELFEDPNDFNRLNSEIEANGGSLHNVECRFRSRDGRLIIGSLSVEEFEVEGTALRMSVVADVTPLREAEAVISKVTQSMIEAQEGERLRIARELHDDIGQRLTMWQLELNRVVEDLNAMPRSVAGRTRAVHTPAGRVRDPQRQTRTIAVRELRRRVSKMRDIQQRARNIATDLQTLSRELYSPALSLVGIDKSLRRLCADMSTHTGVEIEFTASKMPSSLPAEVSLCLFRVVQEALNNSIKHSGTPRIVVRLSGTPQGIGLHVRDFGTGVSEQPLKTTAGLGLVTMRERVAMVHGTFSIVSPPGGGSEIQVRIPL